MASGSEEVRLKYLYRSLVLRNKARIPLDAARKLVGPDCAFHLYSQVQVTEAGSLRPDPAEPGGSGPETPR